MSSATSVGADARNGDILDWLHEQGKQRGARVPEFDIEKILSVVRAARKSDSRMEGSAHEGGSRVLRIMLGRQLRRLREATGMTREDAGAHIRASGSKISRMELGRVSLKEHDVTELLELYGVNDPAQRGSLLQLAREATGPAGYKSYRDVTPDWFEIYVGLEEAAQLIRVYEVQFVPSLLQTEEYARAVMLQGAPDLKPGEVDRKIAALMRRQKLLGKETPPRLWAIVDEAALRRPIGGREVLVAQIEQLIDAVSWPFVTLQIMPLSHGGQTAPGGAFSIMRFPEADVPDIVFVHYPTGSLCLDKPSEVERYLAKLDALMMAGTSPDRTKEILRGMLNEI